jgi:predicted nucleic acid-binding protein
MSVKTFVDTNVLIYAYDIDAGKKHTIASNLLRELWATRSGVLSPQVLQEFYVNVTRKIAKPLSKVVARSVVEDYAVWSAETSAVEIAMAFRIEDGSKISFWDALICASALKAGASRILSEDLSHGQNISGVRVENPFI